MKFKINEVVSNDDIVKEFRCSPQGGMRRSKKTNTLVLISDMNSKLYQDIKKTGNLWWYSGMGHPEDGDQKIEYKQNATLYQSLTQNIDVHLFRKNKKEYTYLGQVLLAGDYERVPDDNNPRTILSFPLIELGNAKNVTKFLLGFEKRFLLNKKILNIDGTFSIEHIDKLIDLMKSKQIDTLFSEGGWFLNIHGYFYNKFSEREKVKDIDLTVRVQDRSYKENIFKGQNEYINPYFEHSNVYSNARKYSVSYGITAQVISKDDSEGRNFRVCKLKIKNSLFDGPIVFFEEEEENEKSFYTSMLIGINGTGKSLVISTIQKIFLDLYLIKRSEAPIHTKDLDIELEYKLGRNLYTVERKENKFFFKIDGGIVDLLDIDLPEELISSAFTVQDRFSILEGNPKKMIKNYHYLGFKKDNIENLESFLAANIMNAVETNATFLRDFESITTFLDYEKDFKLIFKNKLEENFESIFTVGNISNLRRNKYHVYVSPQYKSFENIDITKYEFELKMIKREALELRNEKNRILNGLVISPIDTCEFYQSHKGRLESYINFNDSANTLELYFDVENASKYEEMGPEFENLRNLIKLGVFSEVPEIQMKKNGEWLSLNNASSGELQYIFTMINILTKIKDRSLVIIDEPETSLHPNWQYKYMANLQEIFKNYPTSHFIFATHSHFMIANLKKESSSLIELKRRANKTLVNTIDGVMFGRSIEDILYDVFNLPSSRNYYIASDIDDVLKALAEETITLDITKKVQKLKNVATYLNDKDPLKELIIQMERKVCRYEI